jgi:hypothetical protein
VLVRVIVLAVVLQAFVGCSVDLDAIPLQRVAIAELAVEPEQTATPSVIAPKRESVEAGRGSVRGHVFNVPEGFHTHDGQYDLVVHFHGNTDAVLESHALAGIDAVLVIVNLGEGADLYDTAFADPSAFKRLRRRVGETMKERGVAEPELRRIGLTAWSAGYGAVLRIIDQPVHRDRIDAVLLFDGMHAGYMPITREVSRGDAGPFIRMGARAANDELLFVVTHSQIQPVNPELASVKETADLVLEHVGAIRTEVAGTDLSRTVKPRYLEAVRDIYSQRSVIELYARSLATKGQLVVAEYDGSSPLHHVAHLLQMSQIGLPRLVDRWKRRAVQHAPR